MSQKLSIWKHVTIIGGAFLASALLYHLADWATFAYMKGNLGVKSLIYAPQLDLNNVSPSRDSSDIVYKIENGIAIQIDSEGKQFEAKLISRDVAQNRIPDQFIRLQYSLFHLLAASDKDHLIKDAVDVDIVVKTDTTIIKFGCSKAGNSFDCSTINKRIDALLSWNSSLKKPSKPIDDDLLASVFMHGATERNYEPFVFSELFAPPLNTSRVIADSIVAAREATLTDFKKYLTSTNQCDNELFKSLCEPSSKWLKLTDSILESLENTSLSSEENRNTALELQRNLVYQDVEYVRDYLTNTIVYIVRRVCKGAIQFGTYWLFFWGLWLALWHPNANMLEYIMWAIPSVGFVGTVWGISAALSKAHIIITSTQQDQASAIQEITGQLGVSFDTTLVSLVLSILLYGVFYARKGRVSTPNN